MRGRKGTAQALCATRLARDDDGFPFSMFGSKFGRERAHDADTLALPLCSTFPSFQHNISEAEYEYADQYLPS